jgi:hypothetical protein
MAIHRTQVHAQVQRCLTFLFGIACAGAAGAVDLSASPPPVAAASVELLRSPLPTGNTVLRVRFADERRGSTIPIDGGRGTVPLRDDGVAPDAKALDGEFAAHVHLDPQAYAREQARRAGLAKRVQSVPVFGLRELLRWEPFRPPKTLRLEPGVRVPIDGFLGVPMAVDPARELLIRHTLVVDDPERTYNPCLGVGTPMGAWTFGHLVTEIANQPVTGVHPADLAEHWVQQWQSNLSINGFFVPARVVGAQRLLDAWPRTKDGRLDLAQAPFRLLAIVNRQDLRGNSVYGGSGAGEARLVFGGVDCSGTPGTGGLFPEAQQFTVIFEYGINRSSCPQVRDWAQQWHALGDLALGSAAYNAALQAITDQFTLRDANLLRPPNRSAINQVRTNEIALADIPADSFWQLRESKLRPKGSSAGLLEHVTVAQTPDRSISFTATLRDYINGAAPSILAGTHLVPLQYPPGSPFRGGHIEPGAGFPWDAAGIIDLNARHLFGLATCNGCHTTETGTTFVHIEPRIYGAESALSDFLTGAGMPKSDPVSGVPRTFHDLLDRQMKLDLTAHMICLKAGDFAPGELFFKPLVPMFAH